MVDGEHIGGKTGVRVQVKGERDPVTLRGRRSLRVRKVRNRQIQKTRCAMRWLCLHANKAQNNRKTHRTKP